MKFYFAALALMAVGVSADHTMAATTTISAPCGTSCPTGPAADKMITRSAAPMATSPCPSLKVSSVAMNGTGVMGGASPTPATFKGAANQVAGSVGAVIAAAAFALVL
ncbi:hypothetical protein N7G274_008264 [Stereocaulon virgatum]|uniref:Uncharacterized protein n=1 Tax=Stereocaulon virgatum TaxID=373712 RepID=A0ABR3ZZ06_9LECA